VWRDTGSGEVHTETAKVVVMAGGCVENPRLWLNSKLPNPNGWVGRGLTDHQADWVVGVMPYYTGSSKGPNSAARCDFPGRGSLENSGGAPAQLAFSNTQSDAGIAGSYDNGAPGSRGGADSMGRLLGNDLRRVMGDLDRLMTVLVLTDDHVRPENRVTLSSQLPPDEHGAVPRVEIQHRARGRRTFENREFLVRQAVRLLRAGGARRVFRLNWAPQLLHIQSTMRMGSGASDSVLDADGRARFVQRLYVADNSALPNALGGPNPTLTAQALATRTAERIFRTEFGGSPWVGCEAPVTSIDKRVTKAVRKRGL